MAEEISERGDQWLKRSMVEWLRRSVKEETTEREIQLKRVTS